MMDYNEIFILRWNFENFLNLTNYLVVCYYVLLQDNNFVKMEVSKILFTVSYIYVLKPWFLHDCCKGFSQASMVVLYFTQY